MGQPIIDIVVTTRNRLDYLRQTLGHIWERTRSPYKLHVIDDGSDEGNAEWLLEKWYEGLIETLLLRAESHGLLPNMNIAPLMTFSDPLVVTDDDVLCPDVEPDWLERGTEAMRARKHLGLLALNHPGARRKVWPESPHPDDAEVVYCKYVGGTLTFVRRALAQKCAWTRHRYDFGTTPALRRCGAARRYGYEVGYLRETYCHHIGAKSILTGKPYGRMIEPVDIKTFAPPERWRY